MDYDSYNREERYLCAHLFRLLHQWIAEDGQSEQLNRFLEQSGVDRPQHQKAVVKIYFEVALIRDAYHARRPTIGDFMDQLAREVARQEQLNDFRLFTGLPDVLQDQSKTHPKQIRQKAENEGIQLSKEEAILYGAIQGMFNAKPDLAIMSSKVIIAYEAKFTQAFDRDQTSRTQKIAEVWSRLLYRDLGFDSEPDVRTATIGPRRASPDISWEWLFDRTTETFPTDDRTYIAMKNAVQLLSELNQTGT